VKARRDPFALLNKIEIIAACAKVLLLATIPW